LSEIRANTISAANGTDPVTLTKQSAAKAYCRYNMNTLQYPFNVSSGVDNGTGSGSVNLTNAMNASGFPVTGSGEGGLNTTVATFEKGYTTTASRIDFNHTIMSPSSGPALSDGYVNIVAHGDLA